MMVCEKTENAPGKALMVTTKNEEEKPNSNVAIRLLVYFVFSVYLTVLGSNT